MSRCHPAVWGLLLLVGAHLGIVCSTVWQERPVIWPLHNDTIHRAGRGADLYAAYHAALNLRQGLDPYANNGDGVTPYWYPFRYLPIVAMAFRPLTALPPHVAYLVWALALEALLAALLITLWKRIPERGLRLAAIGMLLLSSPYFLELYMGQFTFAAITLCCLGLLLPGGPLLYAASVLLKPLTLAALPALACQRRYWWHAACGLLCVLVVTLPYFLRHAEQWPVFFKANFRLQGGLDPGNYGFVRLLQLTLQDLHARVNIQDWYRLVGSLRVVTLGVTALLVFHARKRVAVAGAAALLLAHVLTYQHVWEHHMSGVCVLGAALLTVPDRRRAFNVAVVASLLVVSLPTVFGVFDVAKSPSVVDPTGTWPRYALYAIVLSKVLPTLTLYVTSLAYLCGGGLLPPLAAIRASR